MGYRIDTVVASAMVVEQPESVIPIGKPIDNARLYVLNQQGFLKPIGSPGELYIGGAGVGVGYLNRPNLTDETFIPNPFRPGERMFRTGDLARWRPDGTLECLGRIDQQVKVRGFRIELGELEHVMKRHAPISQAAAAVRQDSAGREHLCGYYVASQPVEIEALRRELGEALPEYMVPAFFMQLDELPLTARKQLDRKALPVPEVLLADPARLVPRPGPEHTVAEVWREVLGREELVTDANFFKVGGELLTAWALASGLRREFELRPGDVFRYQTIAEQVASLQPCGDNVKRRLHEFGEYLRRAAGEPRDDDAAALQAAREEYEKRNEGYAELDLDESRPYQRLLLTGATGYVGAYLLRELLTALPEAKVDVVVQGRNTEEAKERLREKLVFYFGEDHGLDESRWRVRAGDLSQQALGLDPNTYDDLAAGR